MQYTTRNCHKDTNEANEYRLLMSEATAIVMLVHHAKLQPHNTTARRVVDW